MGMVVNHNIPALQTYNVVNATSNALAKSIKKLSTGMRINSAADDAAGLAISEKMRAQINGLSKATDNAEDAISMLQTAEGALSQTHSILQRMRELSVQAANDTLTAQDRGYIQEEVDQLRQEITNIGNTTQFNTKKLLNGDAAALWSASDTTTKAIINGGLRTIDAYGQKASAEGNYKISITAEPGVAQVQKTDIMKLKHDVSSVTGGIVDSTLKIEDGAAKMGLDKVKAEGLPAGNYNVSVANNAAAAGGAVSNVVYALKDNTISAGTTTGELRIVDAGTTTTAFTSNANVLLDVESVDSANGNITCKVTANILNMDGTTETKVLDNLITVNTTGVDLGQTLGISNKAGELMVKLNASTDAAKFKKGDKIAFSLSADSAATDMTVTTTGEFLDGSTTSTNYSLSGTGVKAESIDLVSYYKDGDEIKEGTITLDVEKGKFNTTGVTASGLDGKTAASFVYSDPNAKVELIQQMGTTTNVDGTNYTSLEASGALDTGTYTITAGSTAFAGTAGVLTDSYIQGDAVAGTDIKITTNPANLTKNANIVLEVANIAENGDITFKAYGSVIDGSTANTASSTDVTEKTVTITKANYITGVDLAGISYFNIGADATLALSTDADDKLTVGDVFVYNVTSGHTTNGANTLAVTGPGTTASTYGVAALTTASAGTYTLKNYTVDDKGKVSDNTIKVSAGAVTVGSLTQNPTFKYTNNWEVYNALKEAEATSTSTDTTIGKVATSENSIRDVDKFWTSEGVFMITDPQTITITQGDGKQAKVTIYATDTLGDVADKLNDAIANEKTGLGQAAYLADKDARFVTFVDEADEEGANSVAGTFVIRSAVAGGVGELNFSASENLLNALSLNELQASRESQYTVNIEDAHTGKAVTPEGGVKITGNKLIGVINPNVDVQFDAMLGGEVKATDNKGYFKLKDSGEYTTYLHLADNTTVFQVGANEGEDMGVNIGDMRATALGLDSVLVTDRNSAARSITIIDNAIDKVSTQRAKLGAYQNRLEYKVSNLTTAYENMTSAESRIRDTDMAAEMMNFMKLQINSQAGTAMLAQANQLTRNVLSLLG